MSPSLDEPTWTVDQVAEYLNCSPYTVRRMISRGELKAVRIGGRQRGLIRVAPADVRKAMRPVTRIGGGNDAA